MSKLQGQGALPVSCRRMSRKKKRTELVVRPVDLVVTREQTNRALVGATPEELELGQGLRRGRSGELWSAQQAAEALAGAKDARELMAVTNELLLLQGPGVVGLTSIDPPGRKKTPWQAALEEHPPDNAE